MTIWWLKLKFPNEKEARALSPKLPCSLPLKSILPAPPRNQAQTSQHHRRRLLKKNAPKANKSVAVTVPAALENTVDVVTKMQVFEDALEQRDNHIKQLKTDMFSIKEMLADMIALNKAAAPANTPAVIQPSSQVTTLEHQLSNLSHANTFTLTSTLPSLSANASDIMALVHKQEAERSKASLHILQMEFLLRGGLNK